MAIILLRAEVTVTKMVAIATASFLEKIDDSDIPQRNLVDIPKMLMVFHSTLSQIDSADYI